MPLLPLPAGDDVEARYLIRGNIYAASPISPEGVSFGGCVVAGTGSSSTNVTEILKWGGVLARSWELRLLKWEKHMSKSGFYGLKILVVSRFRCLTSAMKLLDLTMRLVGDNPRTEYIFRCRTVSANSINISLA
jgi:hypothetical protein